MQGREYRCAPEFENRSMSLQCRRIVLLVPGGELLVQVWRVAGAGVEKGLGPAPLERIDARFAERVPPQKPHLRQGVARPAPCGIGSSPG